MMLLVPKSNASDGFCRPVSFEVSSVAKPRPGHVALLCERKFLNEVGTGGLLGPVVVCRER